MGQATLGRVSGKSTEELPARSPAGQAKRDLVWHPCPLDFEVSSPYSPKLGCEVGLRVYNLNNVRCRHWVSNHMTMVNMREGLTLRISESYGARHDVRT